MSDSSDDDDGDIIELGPCPADGRAEWLEQFYHKLNVFYIVAMTCPALFGIGLYSWFFYGVFCLFKPKGESTTFLNCTRY
jgi:hypothetical protein